MVRVTGDAAKQRDQVGNSLFGVVVFEGATEGGVFDTFLLDTLIVDAREVMRRNPSARRRR